jgi:hypothetical protein
MSVPEAIPSLQELVWGRGIAMDTGINSSPHLYPSALRGGGAVGDLG